MRQKSVTSCAMLAVILGQACSSNDSTSSDTDTPTTSPTARTESVYEQSQYFEGLEEWVVIHKSASEYYCRRADGRKQKCGDVQREDAAAYYAKWGVMTKAFALKVLAAPPEQIFRAHITFDVPLPPKMTSSAQKAFFAEVVQEGAGLEALVKSLGGTIIASTQQSMPELTVSANAAAFRKLAWTPKLVMIREAIKSQGWYASGRTDNDSGSSF